MADRSGIVGVSLSNDAAAQSLCQSLQVLRHRGGGATDIAVHDGFQQRSTTVARPVGVAFERADLDEFPGSVGVARTSDGPDSAGDDGRAFGLESRRGPIALAIDGDPDYDARGRTTAARDCSDAMALLRAVASALRDADFASAVERVARRLVGDFALVALHDGVVVGVRGPSGGRPLALGTVGAGRVLASESVVFDVLGGTPERTVESGELVVLERDSVRREWLTETGCSVGAVPELVHHARSDAVIDGRSVWAVRTALGRELGRRASGATDIVVPGSETGRPVAVGYAEVTGTRHSDVVHRNRYSTHARLGSLPDPDPTVVGDAVRGERVTVVDSTVTDRLPAIATALAEAGARTVDVRAGARPSVAEVEGVAVSNVEADSVTVLDDDAVSDIASAERTGEPTELVAYRG